MSTLITSDYVQDAAPISGNGPINQGDMLYETGGAVASLSSSANSGTFCGVAVNGFPSQYQGSNNYVPFKRSGLFHFNGTPSDGAYAPGTKLYVGANAQTVTSVASGTSIGYAAYDQRAASVIGQVAVVIEVAL